ncbi:MAG: hypothetical protein CW691_03900 [Candidatus Bathyarchaeum sp.]|nr:MAG: hypothetical protein CW691_03900 [Candidatus Bathyarchaeum sp.]
MKPLLPFERKHFPKTFQQHTYTKRVIIVNVATYSRKKGFAEAFARAIEEEKMNKTCYYRSVIFQFRA